MEQATAYSLGLNLDVANGINEAICKISSEMGSLVEYGYLNNIIISTSNSDAYARYSKSLGTVILNKKAKRKNAMALLGADALEEYEFGAWSSGHPLHSIYHELGHAVEYMILDDNPILKNKINVLCSEAFGDIVGKNTVWKIEGNEVAGLAKKAKDAGFSYYGMRNSGEFVAEAVAQYYCSDNPSELTKKIIKTLKEG